MRRLGFNVLALVVGLIGAFIVATGSGVYKPALAYADCDNGTYVQLSVYTWCGYFDNRLNWGAAPYQTGAFVFISGVPAAQVNSAATLINFMKVRLNGNVAQAKTGAAFIVDTMEGEQAGSAGGSRAAAAVGGANWNEWSAAVTADDRDGLIDWNYSAPFPCGIENTYYQAGNYAAGKAYNDDAFFFESPASGDGCGPNAHVAAIAFKSAAAGHPILYVIKRQCGNPIGKLQKIQDENYTVTPSGFATTTQVVAGQTDTLHVQLKTSGQTSTEPGNLETNRPADINQPCNPACVGPGQTALSGGHDSADGFRANSAIGEATPDWYWVTKSIATGVTTTATFNFTVSAAAAPGNITFHICYNPANQNNATTCAAVTITVVSERSPAVVGENGDVHAGGGICGSPLDENATVTGYPGSGSNTEYVVSATAAGGITNFGSNGSTASGTADNLGQNGGYTPTTGPPWPTVDEVCREDLLAAAENYVANGGTGYGTITAAMAANLNVGTLGAEPVYYWNGAGGTLHLSGTVNQKITIVAEAGTVEIDGNIQINNASYAIDQLPSLGIIAAGNINISETVTRVDAYLFSNGNIDTCYQGQASTTACVGPSLVINGFVMGKSLSFHREGAFNVDGSPVTETIVLNPQIYLNPPKFFDASVDNVLLEGQGEKPPLY